MSAVGAAPRPNTKICVAPTALGPGALRTQAFRPALTSDAPPALRNNANSKWRQGRRASVVGLTKSGKRFMGNVLPSHSKVATSLRKTVPRRLLLANSHSHRLRSSAGRAAQVSPARKGWENAEIESQERRRCGRESAVNPPALGHRSTQGRRSTQNASLPFSKGSPNNRKPLRSTARTAPVQ